MKKPKNTLKTRQKKSQNAEAKEGKELRQLSEGELKSILEAHNKALETKWREGKQALLDNANLQGANLIGENLQEASLCGANLQEARLESANLQKARLVQANLQEVDLVVGVVAESLREDALAQKLVDVIADQILPARIVEPGSYRVDELQALIYLPEKEHAAVRTETLISCSDLDAAVECRLEEGRFLFTHQVILRFRGGLLFS